MGRTPINNQTFDLSQALCHLPRSNMVLCQALCHLLERDNSSRSYDPDLTHSSTQHLANMAGASNKFACTNQHRANRRDKSLAQTEHDRIRRLHQYFHRYLLSNRGIEDACTVDV